MSLVAKRFYVAGGNSGNCFCRGAQLAANDGKQRMRGTYVKILNNLHIVRGDYHADITKFFHFAALKTSQANREGSRVASRLQGAQHVRGITTPADGESYIARL